MEHLHHFQLSEDPFRVDGGDKFEVELASQSDAQARLERAVRQGRGLVLLVGASGSGKTQIARRLYEALEEEMFEAAMMVVLRREVDGDWLLERFAKQLGVDEPESAREALIGQIYERLAIIHEDGRRAVMIVDDAHGLASADTLAELCGLLKLEYEDRRLLSVVLVGAPMLDEAIAADPLIAHHVDVRVSLAPLDREEATAYVAGRLSTAGADAKLLLPGAAAALHELAEGAPGRMNTLADNALYEAWIAARSELTRADVEAAARALGWKPGASAIEAKPGGDATRRPLRRPDAQQAEQTVMGVAPAAAADAPPTQLMDFESDELGAASAAAPASVAAMAEATRVELRDGDLDGPPKEPNGDDVDDLFMELLDD